MIGTRGAAVLFAINVLFASVLGIGAGGLTCLVLRRSWGARGALIDALLAAVAEFAAAHLVAAIEIRRGVWESGAGLILVIAVSSVVVRHLIPAAFRPAD